MTNRDLFDALRDIDDELILNAAPNIKSKQTQSTAQPFKWGMIAACLCLSVLMTFSVIMRLQKIYNDNTVTPVIIDKANGSAGATLDNNSSKIILDILEKGGWTETSTTSTKIEGDYSLKVANEVIQYDSIFGRLWDITNGRVLVLDPDDRESLNSILQSLYPEESTSGKE